MEWVTVGKTHKQLNAELVHLVNHRHFGGTCVHMHLHVPNASLGSADLLKLHLVQGGADVLGGEPGGVVKGCGSNCGCH